MIHTIYASWISNFDKIIYSSACNVIYFEQKDQSVHNFCVITMPKMSTRNFYRISKKIYGPLVKMQCLQSKKICPMNLLLQKKYIFLHDRMYFDRTFITYWFFNSYAIFIWFIYTHIYYFRINPINMIKFYAPFTPPFT